MRLAGRIVAATVLLGLLTFACWFLALRSGAMNGPGPFLDPRWYGAWIGQAALAFGLFFAWERLRPSDRRRTVVVVALGAWVGQLMVLVAIGLVLSNEVTPPAAVLLWLLATGAGLQPLCAVAGGLLAHRLGSRRSVAVR